MDSAQEISSHYRVKAMVRLRVLPSRKRLFNQHAHLQPTFIFLSGSMEVERISGADRECVTTIVINRLASACCSRTCSSLRKLEAAVAKLAGSSTASSFTGTGHTLGGSSTSTASPKSTAAHPAVLRFSGPDAGLDPQLKVLLALVAAYLSFWYLSS